MKDTENPHIFNYPLSKKDKTIGSSLFFPPHEGFNNFYAHDLCYCGERWENPQMQAFPPFLQA